jgi:hypothetical protein
MQLEEKPKDGIVGKGFLYIIGGIVGFFVSMIILWLLFPKLESPVIPVIVSIARVIKGIGKSDTFTEQKRTKPNSF